MDEVRMAWAGFFAAEVGAAATLSGLLMVAMSINLRRILGFPQLPGRAAEMFVLLVAALLACSLGLVPGQPLRLLGVEILCLGVVMTAFPIVIQARTVSIIRTQPLTWWLWRHLIALAAGVPVFIAGIYLVAGAGGGLYWLAVGVLLTLAGAVWNAWVLLVEILR